MTLETGQMHPNVGAVERTVRRRWRDRRVGAQGAATPPTAVILGRPTAGHGTDEPARVETRIMLDVVARYRAMDGDPVETVIGVDGDAGATAAADDALGCLRSHRPCPDTTDPVYVDSVWWALSTLWDLGRLYEVRPHEPWCRSCGQWHPHAVRPVSPPAATVAWVRFPVTGDGALHRAGASLAVRTAAPWLVPAVTAVVVDPAADQVLAQAASDDYPVVIERAWVSDVLGPDATVHRAVGVGELDGQMLRHPLGRGATTAGPRLRDLVVIDACDAPTASGVLAPAFDDAAHAVARRHGVAEIDPVNVDGRYGRAAGPCAGAPVVHGDDVVVAALRDRGLLLLADTDVRATRACAACGTAMVHRARPAWRLATSRLRDRLAVTERLTGDDAVPGPQGTTDWVITRDDPGGTPLPLWRCDGCAAVIAVDGRARLAALAGRPAPTDHAGVGDVSVPCPTCSTGVAQRIALSIEPLLVAAAMPFARFGFPHAPGSDELVARWCHAAVLAETRADDGWADAVRALALLLWDAPAHDTVVELGAPAGTGADTTAVVAEHGADTVRWAAVTAPTAWASDADVLRWARRTITRVLDAAVDFAVSAARAGWDTSEALAGPPPPDFDDRDPRDVTLLAALATTVTGVRQRLDACDAPGAATHVQAFIDELSRWRQDRHPAADGGHAGHPLATFHECLVTLAAVLAPFTPFVADEIYERLVRADDPRAPDSVHLLRYPTPDPMAFDARRADVPARAGGRAYHGGGEAVPAWVAAS